MRTAAQFIFEHRKDFMENIAILPTYIKGGFGTDNLDILCQIWNLSCRSARIKGLLIEEKINGNRLVVTDMSKEKISFLFPNKKALLTPKLRKTSKLAWTLWIMHFEQGIISLLFLIYLKEFSNSINYIASNGKLL
jgi:hypothetical protein